MKKAVTINPNSLSQPAGATLALMGVKGMVPLWHGVQGCTAFAKNLFISHFHEPMPFQNTAISQTNVIMGSEDNIVEALVNLKDHAEMIGVLTTGVAETSGVDLKAALGRFRNEYSAPPVVFANTPDFEGNLSAGYVKITEMLLDKLAPERTESYRGQVAVFPGPYFTPGEIEMLRTLLQDYGLRPLFCPDLGDSLFGYLHDSRFSPCSTGGITVEDIRKLPGSDLVLSLGSTMAPLAACFAEKHGIPLRHYDHLATMSEIDDLYQSLEWTSGTVTPLKYRRQRHHYQDTLLDTDFFFHGKAVAVAGDPEFITRWKAPLNQLRVQTVCFSNEAAPDIQIGDLAAFEKELLQRGVDFIIGNSHVARIAEAHHIPAIRCGMPVTDRFGEPQSVRIGYEGASRLLMECANAAMLSLGHPDPYVSPLQMTLE